MRLSGSIKKEAPSPIPKKKAEIALVPPAPSSEAKQSFYSSPPSTKKGLFRLSDMIGKKPAVAPAPPVRPAERPQPAVDKRPPEAGATAPPAAARNIFCRPEARVLRSTERLEERKEKPADAAVAPAPVPLPPRPEITETAIDAKPPEITKPFSPPVQAQVEDDFLAKKKSADLKPASPTQRGEPTETFAGLPEVEGVSRYEESRVGIYEVCRQFGLEVPKAKNAIIEQAKVCLTTVFKKILLPSSENDVIWSMIKNIASDIEGIIVDDTTVLNILHRYRVKEDKLVWHSLYTAILAMDLARTEKNLSCSIYDVGGAALLHDVGFLIKTTGGFATNGFDAIMDNKAPELREHVGKSIELARRIDAPDVVITMIAQHQGRIDGHGFPPGLSRSTFLRSSQIVAIANVFEHAVIDITMEKGNGAPQETEKNGMPQTFNEYRNAFSIDLLKKMIALIGFYPVGSIVELNNREICQVVKQNRDFPLRPVVKIILNAAGDHPETDQIIDLKQVQILSILRNIARPKNVL